MQFGKPLRTIVVEPLELPVNEPTVAPEPQPKRRRRIPSRCQSRREHPRLHFADCRLACLDVEHPWVKVTVRADVASRPAASGEMQGFYRPWSRQGNE